MLSLLIVTTLPLKKPLGPFISLRVPCVTVTEFAVALNPTCIVLLHQKREQKSIFYDSSPQSCLKMPTKAEVIRDGMLLLKLETLK